MFGTKEIAPVLFSDVDTGRLPPICVVTGQPAAGSISKSFVNTPGWTWGLLPINLLATFVARLGATESITAGLPVARGIERITGITARAERQWLVLRGVHPSFARAVGRQYADFAGDIPIR